jgi:hypothetical protein
MQIYTKYILLCKTLSFINIFPACFSVFLLSIIAFDRYQRICCKVSISSKVASSLIWIFFISLMNRTTEFLTWKWLYICCIIRPYRNTNNIIIHMILIPKEVPYWILKLFDILQTIVDMLWLDVPRTLLLKTALGKACSAVHQWYKKYSNQRWRDYHENCKSIWSQRLDWAKMHVYRCT